MRAAGDHCNGALGFCRCFTVGRLGAFMCILWALQGLSLTLYCRATLQNMPVGWGECRDQPEEANSDKQLMVWARSPSNWMLKAVSFEIRETNSQTAPRKLLFTYKMCQKGVPLPSALKSTSKHTKKNHQINKYLAIGQKPRAWALCSFRSPRSLVWAAKCWVHQW